MKAPDKIYLQEPTKVRTEKKYDNDVKYVRADVLIEKAQLFLTDKLKEIPIGFGMKKIKADCSLKEFIDEFIEYIKGE